METDRYYQIICSDWQKEFYSEEMLWEISWFQKNSFEYLEGLKNLNFSESVDRLFINSNKYLNNKNIPDELLK